MTTFLQSLKRSINAMPRAIRFPYGEQAFGLTTYSAIPKHGAANRKSAEIYRSFLAGRSFKHRLAHDLATSEANARSIDWTEE